MVFQIEIFAKHYYCYGTSILWFLLCAIHQITLEKFIQEKYQIILFLSLTLFSFIYCMMLVYLQELLTRLVSSWNFHDVSSKFTRKCEFWTEKEIKIKLKCQFLWEWLWLRMFWLIGQCQFRNQIQMFTNKYLWNAIKHAKIQQNLTEINKNNFAFCCSHKKSFSFYFVVNVFSRSALSLGLYYTVKYNR